MIGTLGDSEDGLRPRPSVQTAVEVHDYRKISGELNAQKDPPSRLW